jgi:hypothetical protein
VDDHFRPSLGDRGLGYAVVGEVAVSSPERMDLVGSVSVAQLVDQRSADEPGRSRDQDIHARRVYWRAFALLTAVFFAAGCHDSKRQVEPKPPPKPQSFLALEGEHQRLVRDYEPVSRALTGYELGFRDWRAGRLSDETFELRTAGPYRRVVVRAVARLRRDSATGETRRAKRLLVTALRSRAGALAALPRLAAYQKRWNRSVVDARAGLTVLQDIRDRARLIPLPEDAVS